MKLCVKFAWFALAGAPMVLSGCAKHIVRADSPSVVAEPIPEPRPVVAAAAPQPEPTPPPEIPQPEPELSPPLAAEPVPPRPRPPSAPVASAQPVPSAPAPAPPRISPVLSAAEQERLTQLATNQIRVAERNVQSANGKRLSSAQQDLYQKVQGFLAQAHDAIRVNDWVRAQNLAEKAQVLSSELVKSF